MCTWDYLRAIRGIAVVIRPWRARILPNFMATLGLGMLLAGCALSYESTKTPRAPSEQLLLAQSLRRSLIDAVLPLRSGQTIAVETVGLTADQAFANGLIEKWLSRGGLLLPKDGKRCSPRSHWMPSGHSRTKPSLVFLRSEEDLSHSHCPNLRSIKRCGNAAMLGYPSTSSKKRQDALWVRRRSMRERRTTINIRSCSPSVPHCRISSHPCPSRPTRERPL